MFDFLRNWLHGKDDAANTQSKQTSQEDTGDQAQVAPGTHIHYDPNLVQKLKDDHRHIEKLFSNMVSAAQRHDSALLKQSLADFNTALRAHLLTENVRFYVYLQHSLGADPENTALVQGFRREMQHIGRTLGDFMLRHAEVATRTEEDWAALRKELGELAPVLKKRIETEESILYPLYMPPLP